MQRIAMAVAYLGNNYCGWQVQLNQPTVQQFLEDAIFKVAGHPVFTICAGRTDSGVHSLMQVVHFDAKVSRSERQWLAGVNANLPKDISVCWVVFVNNDFHARFLALSREYLFCIDNCQQQQVFWHQRALWVKAPLDADKMQQAGLAWLGRHDFSALRASGCQAASAVRCIDEIKVVRKGSMIFVEISANAFLYHMVRNALGVLIPIGQGLKPVGWALEVLQSKSRSKAGVTVSGCGLYLSKVTYPDKFNLPLFGQGICC